MANEPSTSVQCAGCGANYDSSNPDEAQLHAGHTDDVKIEQA